MSIAATLPPAPTAMSLRAAGVVFRRDPSKGNSIVSMKATPEEREVVTREVARRMALMVALMPANDSRPIGLLVICATVPTARTGECVSCGDPRPEHVGGQCELCEVALGKALRATGRIK